MQTLRIGSDETIQAPPAGQPASPTNIPGEGGKAAETGGKPASSPLGNVVSESEAFKAVEGTKITTLLPLTSDPSATGTMGGASVPLGGMLDASLAIELMDALLPSLLVATMAAIGAQMKKTDLQLTAKEKATINPLMQKCLEQLMINFNSPFAALGVTLVVIYGAKVTEKGIVQIIDKKAEKSAAAKAAKDNPAQATAAGPAPVVSMVEAKPMPPPPIPSMQRKPLSMHFNPTPEQIFMAKKKVKGNEAFVIQRLRREHAAGTLEKFLKVK